MDSSLKEAILRQREMLTGLLIKPMRNLAKTCAGLMNDRAAMEALLQRMLPAIDYCQHLFVLDANGVQFTDNITHEGHDARHYGRDRSQRPYMQDIIATDFKLSDAYISRYNKRPSLTAMQVIRDENFNVIGFLGADYDLRDLPATQGVYQEPAAWRQIKGDPAIRSGIFLQERVQSQMDAHMDDVLALMVSLICGYGVFHGKLHFSSSRASIWLVNDPFRYRILSIDELQDPDILLTLPPQKYIDQAIVPIGDIEPIFEMLRQLRFADETIYLRAGSLNICNGMVSLNFSCDGSHYIRYDEFLGKGLDFWFGAAASNDAKCAPCG
ncbi:PDC sensor domain-containing protein [Magnetofaba australis]|uniref:Cache domain-containing protein n=1 Tax=Magnetofaba australis IT-1 TaxID=1434232 RepID=A0A1Y2K6C1_9PROT|nr:hypothetical protein [Magnetofaba australis]OSM03971.1 hypothetical protein MAIT1_03781 [Magnetofaba australis IT-1]